MALLGRKWVIAAVIGATATIGLATGGRAPLHLTAAPAGGGCELTGTATFGTPLKATPSTIKYTFKGALSSCQGNAGVSKGTVSASGGGTLSCGAGTSTGTATVTWNNGKKSILGFSTYSATAATAITASIKSGAFAGESGAGSIVFQTTTPQLCATTGLKSLTFTGAIALG